LRCCQWLRPQRRRAAIATPSRGRKGFRPDTCRPPTCAGSDNRAPGRQPGPTNCDRAEAIASRDRHARVIYGVNQFRYGAYGRDDRAVYRVPGRTRAPDVYRGYPRGVSRDTAFQNGYRDGLEKGRDDGRDNDRYDPRGERWYRSADRGYVKSYGSKDRYKDLYRDGFLAGYADGYREGQYRRR
jgi:hypothetical protein